MICVKLINLLSYHYDENIVFRYGYRFGRFSSSIDPIWFQSVSKLEEGLPVSNENKG